MSIKKKYIKGNHYLFENKVVNIEEIATGKFLLTFEKQFDVKAGHVVAIAADESHQPRIYSLCSGETEKFMQILFDLKLDGVLSPKMAKMKPGDVLFVSKPYGSFLPENESAMWWIATGTGIAPFSAMLQSGYKADKLLHGARKASNFYFERDFKLVLKDNYIRCNSGKDGLGDYFGRVTDWIEKQEKLPVANKYYLCGRALMVVEVRDLLIAKGIPYENIVSEIFF
ncbi:MAG: oxidoreductase [Prolixibacteraceae bacterium]|jgi:ferredoxin--NADP+ reductase|nr:oxidoreductase [Prolixibacteraceae bacterium]